MASNLKKIPFDAPIQFNRGNSYSLTFTFDINLTGYTMDAGIRWGDEDTKFVITPGAYTDDLSTVSLYLSPESSLLIDNELNEWYFDFTKTTVKSTFFSGKCKVVQ